MKILTIIAALALSGCGTLGWQASYNERDGKTVVLTGSFGK